MKIFQRIRKELCELICKKEMKVLAPPQKLGKISITEVRKLLAPYCSHIRLSDVSYSLTSVSEAKKFSVATKLAAKRWIKEKYDCDEFSFALMGYWNQDLHQFAFGIAWSRAHAFNIMIDNKKQIWIVEPQTNKFFKIDKSTSQYKPLYVVMI